MYIYADSEYSKKCFNENTTASFRIKLPKQLKLYGRWEVALLEVDMPKLDSSYQSDHVDINTPLCDENIVNDALRPILRRIYKDQLKQVKHLSFTNPIYVPVNVIEVDVIHIYLTDASRAPPSFQPGPLYCVLHLRPCQPI